MKYASTRMTHGWHEHRVPTKRAPERQRMGQRVGGDICTAACQSSRNYRRPPTPRRQWPRSRPAAPSTTACLRWDTPADSSTIIVGPRWTRPGSLPRMRRWRPDQREGYRRFVKYEQQAADNQSVPGQGTLMNRGRAPGTSTAGCRRPLAVRAEPSVAPKFSGDDAHPVPV